MSNERKLVEALNNFMSNTVLPTLSNNNPVLNEWKFLTGILNNAPIQYNQLDFYLHMSNKNNPKTPETLKSQEGSLTPESSTKKNQYFGDYESKNGIRYDNIKKTTTISSPVLKY